MFPLKNTTLQHLITQKKVIFFISIILFVIPFFWLKPGEINLGGDSSRLYFYDPYNFLKSTALYSLLPGGTTIEQSLIMSLPFIVLVGILKFILSSSYIIVSIFNGIMLAGSFLSMYAISQEFIKKVNKDDPLIQFFISIFIGFFYIFSPVMVFDVDWDRALLVSFCYFLNPLIFYLFLKALKENKLIYFLLIILISFIFSTNFSWVGAPTFFSFFPIALLFLLFYFVFIEKKRVSKKNIFLFCCFFITIHLFHLIPFLLQIQDKSGIAFTKAFTSQGQMNIGLAYFLGIAPLITLSKNILGIPQLTDRVMLLKELFFLFPLSIVGGLYSNAKKTFINKQYKLVYSLIVLFSLVSIFLMTAKVTHIGFNAYIFMFNIPGFTMFRNYYGQWVYLYGFFMSLVIGFSLYNILLNFKSIKPKIIILLLFFSITVINALPLINGDFINKPINPGSKTVFKAPIKMDPNYEKVLSFIRNSKADGKYMTFPLTESINQLLIGTQNGLYIGPSTISWLTERSDFDGYQTMAPFSEIFLSITKAKDYESINNLFALLNIRYIYYNSDPRIINAFKDYPYQHIKEYLPSTQKEYTDFLSHLPVHEIFTLKNYHIYEINKNAFLPHIYIPQRTRQFTPQYGEGGYIYNNFFSQRDMNILATSFVDDKKYLQDTTEKKPFLTVNKVNNTKFLLHVKNGNTKYQLVLSDAYNSGWELYLLANNSQQTKSVFETFFASPLHAQHFVVNGYANGWNINTTLVSNKKDYTLLLELKSQKYIYLSLFVSIVVFLVCIVILGMLLYKNHKR